ncbi:hypothetical protein SAMN04487891_113160 [Flagellimonas taeanensis]|uniref:Uncharacterized protein n=1 Tax=Flagellimonas taeanensis TaxID=1005926 RepID=A0A1M6UGB3_9FLAO|nr:hypothetical protein SAMN04487891_113160 [Allomuricauda taeanensis]SHK68305.1 hypothetical protein SAMN05216293_1605 [Allomuricauda taeanensis]
MEPGFFYSTQSIRDIRIKKANPLKEARSELTKLTQILSVVPIAQVPSKKSQSFL